MGYLEEVGRQFKPENFFNLPVSPLSNIPVIPEQPLIRQWGSYFGTPELPQPQFTPPIKGQPITGRPIRGGWTSGRTPSPIRRRMPTLQFASQLGMEDYPIYNIGLARQSLLEALRGANPMVKGQVRKAVYAAYPNLRFNLQEQRGVI